MQDLQSHPRYQEALRHARAVRGFYSHALTYVLVNSALLALNLVASPGRWWFGWTAVGWGIGLLVHGVAVFACSGRFGAEWEQRKVREYLERRG